MAMFGMDIAQVRSLAQLLGQKASDIESLRSQVTSKLNSTEWKGPDADRFRNDWNGTLSSQLQNVVQQLREAQKRATQNAAEQEATSSR